MCGGSAARAGWNQAMIESVADLAHLDELDAKLWVALSCPVEGLEFDRRTLAWIDADGDGRIRVPEIEAAVRFALARLQQPEGLLDGSDGLPLAALRADTEAGRLLLASAHRSLAEIGAAASEQITVAQVSEALARVPAWQFNGDGVVPAECAADEVTGAMIRDMVATVGGAPDLNGCPGASAARLAVFMAALRD